MFCGTLRYTGITVSPVALGAPDAASFEPCGVLLLGPREMQPASLKKQWKEMPHPNNLVA